MKFCDSKKFVSCPGSPIHAVYTPKVEKNGEITLVVSGYENTDDYIQSFAESTDISVIMTRIQDGEVDLLSRRPGSYGDFTSMPQTFAEVLQLQINSNMLFDSLPVDVKQKFNNDSNVFFAQSGTKEWFEKIENVLPDEVKNVVFPKTENVEVSKE